jgi:peptidoglycan/xylan/chitin deacetylase (PgdA/CDA1 family)
VLIPGLALAAGGAALLAHGVYEPNSPVFGPVIGRGPRTPSLYLTFDDGPNPGATEWIVRLLERERLPAAFFMVGRHVERYPDLARGVARAGLTIGNHTYSHARLALVGPRRVAEEIGRAHAAIVRHTGVTPRAFRAPHGQRGPFVRRVAAAHGYRVFGWTFGVWDTARPGSEVIRRRIRRGLRPGAVLLLHDGDGYDPSGDRRQTAEALPAILDDCRALGYQFRPLDGIGAP